MRGEYLIHLAIALGHPIYDCFYLTLAERENTGLITADTRLLVVARKTKIEVRQLWAQHRSRISLRAI